MAWLRPLEGFFGISVWPNLETAFVGSGVAVFETLERRESRRFLAAGLFTLFPRVRGGAMVGNERVGKGGDCAEKSCALAKV